MIMLPKNASIGSLYDIIDLIYRPYDNALTGGDFFFVKNDSNLKSHKGYN